MVCDDRVRLVLQSAHQQYLALPRWQTGDHVDQQPQFRAVDRRLLRARFIIGDMQYGLDFERRKLAPVLEPQIVDGEIAGNPE